MIRAVVIFFLSISFFHINAQDLTQGLVGYYSFCGCNANDHSGNENHGTLIGNPECIEGIKGEGFYMNRGGGTTGCGMTNTQFIQLPTLGAIWEDGITIAAWVEFENAANYERIVDFGNGDGDSGGMNVWFGREGNSDNLTLESWVSSDANQNRSTGRLVAVDAITNGQIEFYCATISGNTMRIYVNGELLAQKQGNPIANVQRAQNYIGRSNWCFADPDFQGFIDEVRIYNRALSDEEILQLYDSPLYSSNYTTESICFGENIQLNAQEGIAYQWSPGINLSATDIANPIATLPATAEYTVKISLPGGCIITDTVRIEVNELEETEINETICEGFSYEGYTRSGTYIDEFTSQAGCDSTRTLNLTVLPGNSLSEVKTICEGERYRGYSASGFYQLTLPSDSGCDTLLELDLQVLPSPAIHNIQISPSSCGQADGSINFSFSGGTGPYTILLNGNPILESSPNNQLTSGDYELSIEDEQGCRQDTLLMVPQKDCEFYLPNVFSPNGDGINDEFRVFSGAGYSAIVKTYRIFDRWGALVYEAGDFSLESDGLWWDGRYNREKVAVGTYVYFVEIELEDGSVEEFNGAIGVIY